MAKEADKAFEQVALRELPDDQALRPGLEVKDLEWKNKSRRLYRKNTWFGGDDGGTGGQQGERQVFFRSASVGSPGWQGVGNTSKTGGERRGVFAHKRRRVRPPKEA